MKNFFDHFIKNIKVFDPLDRDILTFDDELEEEKVVSTKTADLRKYIYDMESMNCEEMSIPLSTFKFQELLKWLDKEQE